jgi:hypothetical protein
MKMKKILMTLAMGMMALTMNAQMYVGGSFGLQSVTPEVGDGETSFQILPEIGFQFDEKWGAGVQIGYISDKGGAYDLDAESAFAFAPYVRYTALKLKNVNLFLDGGFDYLQSKNPKINIFGVCIKPGVAVNLNENISFVAHVGFVGFESFSPKGDGDSSNTVGVDLDGNNVTFCLYFNF